MLNQLRFAGGQTRNCAGKLSQTIPWGPDISEERCTRPSTERLDGRILQSDLGCGSSGADAKTVPRIILVWDPGSALRHKAGLR